MFNAIALSRGGFNECLNHVVDLRFQRRNRGSVGRRAARRHRAAGRQRCGSQLRAQLVRRHRRAGPGNGAMTVTRTPSTLAPEAGCALCRCRRCGIFRVARAYRCGPLHSCSSCMVEARLTRMQPNALASTGNSSLPLTSNSSALIRSTSQSAARSRG